MAGDPEPCDACTFLDAVRSCPFCNRPLCRDCVLSHLCPKSTRRKVALRILRGRVPREPSQTTVAANFPDHRGGKPPCLLYETSQ